MRRAAYFTLILLAFLYCLGVWTGLALAVRSWSADLLTSVNAEVNTVDRRFAPLAAEGDNDGIFDCEDYAWAKYHALAALGVAKERMRLFAVTVADGRRHMILVADGWVLDNLEPRIEPEAKARRYYRDWEDRTNTIVIK